MNKLILAGLLQVSVLPVVGLTALCSHVFTAPYRNRTVHVSRSIEALVSLQPHERVDLAMETLCETGVDEMSWDDTVR